MKKWSEQEITWFISHYPNNGVKYCMDELHITFNQLVGLRNRLKIKLSRETYSKVRMLDKKDHEYSVNPLPFMHITENIIAYLLGLIWADGTIFHRNEIGNRKNSVSLTLIKDDFEYIKPLLVKTGQWSYYTYNPAHNKSKYFISAKTNNKKLIEFLISMDFHIKSGTGADKILAIIPSNLKRYFFCGLIDGDGCFYYNNKNKIRKFSITSTFVQDWHYFTYMMDQLCITYKIVRRQTNKGCYSRIEISNFENLQKLRNYLYPNGFEFGLKRKYDKLELCLSTYTRKS